MKKLLNSSKWVYYILGLISAVIIISSLFFMTQYRFLRVNYIKETLIVGNFYNDAITAKSNEKTKEEWLESKTNRYPKVDSSWFEQIWDAAAAGNQDQVKDLKDVNNVVVYDSNAKLNNADQAYLFNFVNQVANGSYNSYNGSEAQSFYENNDKIKVVLEKDDEGYKYLNYDEEVSGLIVKKTYSISQEMFDKVATFRKSLDNYNNLILAYGIVSLIIFAAFIVLSNHNRKIYYKSNLIGGIVLPIINIVFALILIIQGISLISNISDPTNNAFYNVISALQNPKVGVHSQFAASQATNNENAQFIVNNFNINSTSVVLYMVFFGVTMLYNIFLIVFAYLKYKDTAKARNEVLEKARLAGEKA